MRSWIFVLAALLAAGGAEAKPTKHQRQAAAVAVPLAPGDPNGSWAVEATTTVGECPALIPDQITIAENRVADAPDAKIAAWGYVDETGTLVARFTGEGEHVARLHGALKGGKGSGAWSSSTDMCGGAWRAAQR